MAQKLEGAGIRAGKSWDDGSEHQMVTKMYVGIDTTKEGGIDYIKFDYIDNNGQVKEGLRHGVKYKDTIDAGSIELDEEDNKLEEIKVWFDTTQNKIKQIQIWRTRGCSMIGVPVGTLFTFDVKGKKVVGFYGFTDERPTYLGLHVVSPINIVSLEDDKEWDDGNKHNAVTNVQVGLGLLGGFDYVKFDYIDQNGQPKEGSLHGIKRPNTIETPLFVINHPEEYLVAVDGWYGSSQHVIQGLVFNVRNEILNSIFRLY